MWPLNAILFFLTIKNVHSWTCFWGDDSPHGPLFPKKCDDGIEVCKVEFGLFGPEYDCASASEVELAGSCNSEQDFNTEIVTCYCNNHELCNMNDAQPTEAEIEAQGADNFIKCLTESGEMTCPEYVTSCGVSQVIGSDKVLQSCGRVKDVMPGQCITFNDEVEVCYCKSNNCNEESLFDGAHSDNKAPKAVQSTLTFTAFIVVLIYQIA